MELLLPKAHKSTLFWRTFRLISCRNKMIGVREYGKSKSKRVSAARIKNLL